MPRRKRPLGRRGSHPRLAQGARLNTERIISTIRFSGDDAHSEQDAEEARKQGSSVASGRRSR